MSGQAAYHPAEFYPTTPPSRSRSTQGRHVKAFGLVSRTLGEWAVPRTEYQVLEHFVWRHAQQY
jgi:hypothetical protein